MDQEKEAAFRRIIAADFPAMPGAAELVAALHEAGFGVAVGSSAPRENVEVVIDRLGVRDRFQRGRHRQRRAAGQARSADLSRGRPAAGRAAGAVRGDRRRPGRRRGRRGRRHGLRGPGQHRSHARGP